MRRVLRRSAGMVVVLTLLLPAAAAAQAAITGVVKDASGAVLPGATVEASSPVLIEKVRSVATDSTGQYRIVDLRPGVYSVTFSLTGFNAIKRDGIELTGTFVATVDAELKLGSVEETVTVTGAAPTVDVQSLRVQQTVSSEVLAAIPTSRTNNNIAALVPGLTSIRPDVGGVGDNPTSQGDTGPIHGGRYIDPRSMTDGLYTNFGNGGTGTGNLVNVAGSQEVVVSTSGGLGEAATSGVIVNVIPRDGSNTFSGTVNVSGANGSMQSSNYTQALKDQGLRAPAELISVYDINPMGGGRIVRDRLWFYATFRQWANTNTSPGMWHNQNFGKVNEWSYVPDLSRQAEYDGVNRTTIGRLTWQATQRNKLTGYWSEGYSCERCDGGGRFPTAPEAQSTFELTPTRVFQATYSSPVSSRFLIEAGYGSYKAHYGSLWQTPTGTLSAGLDNSHNTELIQAVEQGGIIPGLTYRFPPNFGKNTIESQSWRASASYVTGSHNMKVGYYGAFLPGGPSQTKYLQEVFQYRFNNGVPNQISISGTYGNPPENNTLLRDTGLYVQDQWTVGRLTLQGALRFDATHTWFPDLSVGGTHLIPQVISFPSGSTQEHNWKDVTPRMGAAYDLFGNAKTAVKFHLGKYVEALSSLGDDTTLNPLQRIALTTTRSWNDRGGLGINGDLVPQCDMANPDANGECGPMANRNLGTNTVTRTWDPDYTSGWGKRAYNWEMALSVQQQLAPRVALTVGYFRRSFGNWYTTQNLATNVSDWTPYYLTAPLDPRLPGGGGYQVGPLYDVVPEKFGQVLQYSTASKNLADQTENWNGVDINLNARWNGLTVQGGTSTGKRHADNCDLRAVNPYLGTNTQSGSAAPVATTINEVSPTNPYCILDEPFLWRTTGLAAYTIPKVAVQVSGTWQSNPGLNPVSPQPGGTNVRALWVVPNAVAQQALGRPLSGGAQNVTVNLIPSGTMFNPRVNQFDFRVAKILRFGKTRTQLSLDCYNCTNTDTALTFNQTFVPGGQWQVPTSVIVARFFKIGAQFDF
jgi:carboxypeptidase family protein